MMKKELQDTRVSTLYNAVLAEEIAAAQVLVEYVKQISGHKNSKGEPAPWVIISHETGKILSSHKTKAEAEKHLQQMHAFKK